MNKNKRIERRKHRLNVFRLSLLSLSDDQLVKRVQDWIFYLDPLDFGFNEEWDKKVEQFCTILGAYANIDGTDFASYRSMIERFEEDFDTMEIRLRDGIRQRIENLSLEDLFIIDSLSGTAENIKASSE